MGQVTWGIVKYSVSEEEVCLAITGPGCNCVLQILCYLSDMQPSLCSEGPHGRASSALRAFRADGLRPCRSPPEG